VDDGWVGLCQYAHIDIGLSPLVEVSLTQTSWQTEVLDCPRKTFGLLRHLSWRTFEFSRNVAKMHWLFSVKIHQK